MLLAAGGGGASPGIPPRAGVRPLRSRRGRRRRRDRRRRRRRRRGGGRPPHRRRLRDYDPLPADDGGDGDDDHDRGSADGGGVRPPTHLLTRGRSSAEVRALRGAYGSNTLHGDLVDDDCERDDDRPRSSPLRKSASRCAGVVVAVLRAFLDQLKEPLILMLLFSAGISLCLGNAADAVSIGMALGIVSMVAAIQEYRSERGESSGGLVAWWHGVMLCGRFWREEG